MLSFFPRDVLDEILNLTESVSEGFPSYSYMFFLHVFPMFLKGNNFCDFFASLDDKTFFFFF